MFLKKLKKLAVSMRIRNAALPRVVHWVLLTHMEVQLKEKEQGNTSADKEVPASACDQQNHSRKVSIAWDSLQANNGSIGEQGRMAPDIPV